MASPVGFPVPLSAPIALPPALMAAKLKMALETESGGALHYDGDPKPGSYESCQSDF